MLKNNRLYIVLFFVLCLVQIGAKAQKITVDASIDSIQRFIGEQARIRLEVSCEANQSVQLPLFVDTLVTGVEIILTTPVDTQFLNKNERMLVSQEYIVTSFDSASYYIPPFNVIVDGNIHSSQALALMVYPMQIDEENPEAIFPPKDVMQIPLIWEDWKSIAWKTPCFILFVIVVIYLINRYKDNKPIIRKVKVEPKLLPHEQAMKELARIKEERNWQKGEIKSYYTELTEVVRVYIHERFDYNAMEKTSDEIIDYLQSLEDKGMVEDLKQLFITADFVKFAKYTPLLNENDLNLVNALEFINRTKVEIDPNEKPISTEITIEEKRSLRTKVMIFVAIILIAILTVILLYSVINDVYNLFL